MYGHLEGCPRCARFDTTIRRGLLVVRNLPTVQPSRDFLPRLEARLHHGPEISRGQRYARTLTGVAAVVAVVLTAVLGTDALRTRAAAAATAGVAPAPRAMVTTPVPRPASAQFLAGLASGVPVWPGVSIADRAAAHLARVELQQANASP